MTKKGKDNHNWKGGITIDKDGYARWYKFENGFLCVKCYRKERRRKP